MKVGLGISVAIAAALAGCQTMDESANGTVAQTTVRMADGSPAGTARLLESGNDINVAVSLAGISPGVHGVHLHTTGSCEPPDFTSAGDHLNPSGREHGFENPQGAHLGDLPNAAADASGASNVSFALRGAREEVIEQIFDADGTAVVVHAAADDYETNPAGDSGSRIACGVLERR